MRRRGGSSRPKSGKQALKQLLVKLPPEDDLHNVIKLLRVGEPIEVLWLDACIARDRKVDMLKNHDFATYKRSIGYYIGVMRDHRYKQEYIIISPEETDEGEVHDIESIPLGIVMRIKRVSGEKVPLITVKGRHYVKVPVRTLKLKWAELVPLDNGGQKVLLAKEVKV